MFESGCGSLENVEEMTWATERGRKRDGREDREQKKERKKETNKERDCPRRARDIRSFVALSD